MDEAVYIAYKQKGYCEPVCEVVEFTSIQGVTEFFEVDRSRIYDITGSKGCHRIKGARDSAWMTFKADETTHYVEAMLGVDLNTNTSFVEEDLR